MKKIRIILMAYLFMAILLSGCAAPDVQKEPAKPNTTPTFGGESSQLLPTKTPEATMTPTSEPTATLTIEPTMTPTPEPTATPASVICHPGTSMVSSADNVPIPYVDIIGVSSQIKGTTLTAVIHFKDIPDEMTIRREGIQKSRTEYDWGVDIDVDNNQKTGSVLFSDPDTTETADYKLMISHWNDQDGPPISGPFDKLFANEALVMKYTQNGMTQVSLAKFVVDTQANTLTLTGTVPGITDKSTLIFSAQDYLPGKSAVYDRVCQMPTLPVEISYKEDFEDNQAQGWQLGKGWKIITEKGNHILHGVGGSDNSGYGYYFNASIRGWADYAYQSKVRFTKGKIFMVVRDGNDGFYNVMLSPSDNTTVFADSANGAYNTFGGGSYKFETEKWYSARIEAQGDNLRLFIDDKLVDQQQRSSHAKGYVGFYLDKGDVQVDIDDIQIWGLPKQ